ncbi:MAG: NAD(P)-dependent alcohol dehydrogenase [Sphingomonadaceae bacterium]|nr:NAD(P)-dependent alcohol dehydrogenase [Sphingomonadaceae bacterium]
MPHPGPGQVLVKVHAVALNRRDAAIRDLSYPVGDVDRFVPGSDAAGEIIGLGEAVSGWKIGDRVASTFFQEWHSGGITLPALRSSLGAGGQGVFADHILLAEHGIVRAPSGWSYAEAACLPCAGVTAWSALMTLGGLQQGDWVLIVGTGGVALFALQIAVAAGARVAILSSSDEKLARAKALGAQVGINYRTTPEWSEVVRDATGGGVQHALELGGAGTLQRTIDSLALGGHVALIGALAGFGGALPTAVMTMKGLRASAVLVGSRASQIALTDFMVDRGIRPVIDSCYGFEQAEEAYRRVSAGAFGKVVVSFAD